MRTYIVREIGASGPPARVEAHTPGGAVVLVAGCTWRAVGLAIWARDGEYGYMPYHPDDGPATFRQWAVREVVEA